MANSNKNDYHFLPKCTCNRRCDVDDETFTDDYYEDDSSYYDLESKDESLPAEKFFFISVYDSSLLKTTNIISYPEEIEIYRTKYAGLQNKTTKNINNLWGAIVINTPMLGPTPLKTFMDALFRDFVIKVPNKRKKQLKKPVSSMMVKKTSSNSSEKLSTTNTNKSTKQLEKSKENLKVENNSSNKNKKVEEMKINSTFQSEDKKTDIEIENKSDKHDIFWCMGYTLVNPKSSQNKARKSNSILSNNIEASVNKEQKPNSVNNTPTINLENKNENKSSTINNSKNQTPDKNTKYNMNEVNKSKSTTIDLLKANISKDQKSNSIKNTPTKVYMENKNENENTSKIKKNKEKEKSISVNQNSTPMKSNIENKNEDIKLINGFKTINTPDKAVKIDTPIKTSKNSNNLANTPTKKNNIVDNNKHNNSNMNESPKKTGTEFKKPLEVKPTYNNTEKNNVKNNKKVAPNNTKNNVYEETIDKATKKKLKKLKQKEKKIERNRTDSSNCSSVDTMEFVSSPDSVNKIIDKNNKIISEELKKTVKNTTKSYVKINTEESEVEKDEDQSEYPKTSDDEVDFLTDGNYLPAFLAKIKEKSKNKAKNNKVNTVVTTKINSNNIERKNLDDGNKEQEFFIHTKKRSKIYRVIDQQSICCSEKLGENACHMILENNFMGAVEYLVDAIDFNYSELRHYLNRCYCYLNMKKFDLALADAKYIIDISTNLGYLFIANVRAAQASYALQRYDQAEAYMHEAIRINPTNVYTARELIFTQVARIVSMGFNEKDALLALEKYSSVKGAVNYLIKNNNNNKFNNFKNEDFKISLDNCNELVYSSDEDEASNTKIVNRMMKYKPGTVKFQHMVAKPANHLACDTAKSTKKEKKVLSNNKANSEQDRAIWVGNLTSSITDTMLKKKFKEFGKVMSIYHPLNETYAFINFEKAEDVTNVLANTLSHEIAGVKLLVKSAIRQK